jgi:hypothetical protein
MLLQKNQEATEAIESKGLKRNKKKTHESLSNQ